MSMFYYSYHWKRYIATVMPYFSSLALLIPSHPSVTHSNPLSQFRPISFMSTIMVSEFSVAAWTKSYEIFPTWRLQPDIWWSAILRNVFGHYFEKSYTINAIVYAWSLTKFLQTNLISRLLIQVNKWFMWLTLPVEDFSPALHWQLNCDECHNECLGYRFALFRKVEKFFDEKQLECINLEILRRGSKKFDAIHTRIKPVGGSEFVFCFTIGQ